jgi:hypothetical protein
VDYAPARVEEILSPRYFVEVRRTFGGPAPAETAQALDASTAWLRVDREWLDERLTRLTDAERELKRRADAL